MRGYMTAWLQPNADMTIHETHIQSLIQQGMENDAYISKDIPKLSYIGIRDTTSTSDPTATNTTVVAGVAEEANKGTTASGALESDDNKPPALTIGLTVFFVAFAVVAALVAMYVKRRKGSTMTTRGPIREEEDSAGLSPLPPPPAPVMMDPDDVNLLPATEKFDMRSIHSVDSDELSNTDDTEDYMDDEVVVDTLEDFDLEDGKNNRRRTAGSSLAAMGVASTVVTSLSGSPTLTADGDRKAIP